MIIEKTAKKISNYRRTCACFESARKGFSFLLAKYAQNDSVVLLPSYIGVSPNEGSGIFDPVKANCIPFRFYGMNKRLHIDVESYRNTLKFASEHYSKILVLIVHYFGYVDPQYDLVCQMAREVNAVIIEDEAHALYTDYIDNACGHHGDYSLFSLHKMLPFSNGGMVRDNVGSGLLEDVAEIRPEERESINPFQFDLYGISQRRKENTSILYKRLFGVQGISFLHDKNETQTPQTVPIVISPSIRNDFYFTLNNAGYGVVSLYHTLIDNIAETEFSQSVALSRAITNLPVHQDILPDAIESMCDYIIGYMARKAKEGLF
jgi:hypothetical protein